MYILFTVLSSENCDDSNFLVSLSAAIEQEGIVVNAAEQVDASANAVGIHRSLYFVMIVFFLLLNKL